MESRKRASSPSRASSASKAPPAKKRKITFASRTRTEDTSLRTEPKQALVDMLVGIQRICSQHLTSWDGRQMESKQLQKTQNDPAFIESITRRATRLCAPDAAEELTLKRAIDTWEDLYQYMQEKFHTEPDDLEDGEIRETLDGSLRAMTVSQLEHFAINAHAPSRVHASLMWMGNNLHISLPIKDKD